MLSLWRHPEVLYEALADIPVWGGWISSVFSSLVCMGKQVFTKRYVGNSPLSAKK
mgnify:FL=1